MPAQFPTPYNSAHSGELVSGPDWLKLEELEPEYPSNVFKEMIDSGGTYGADTTNRVRRFKLVYGGLTAAQAKVLDDHHLSAYGILLGFNYRFWRRTDPSVDELLTDVHYESYVPGHNKTWDCSREIVLIKRPA